MNYFTSDLHFGHANIITYCNRPFKDTDHMDQALREMLLAVPAGSTLWILGDVAMKGKANAQVVADFLKKLPYTIKIIGGNHDKGRIEIYDTLVEHANGRHEYVIDGHNVSMGHHPMEDKDPIKHPMVYLNGHVHDEYKFKTFGTLEDYNINCNVGYDVWHRPVTIDEIVAARDEFHLNLFNK